MGELGRFPFGQPVRKVEQSDRTPKRVFHLGVYASAVHAQWVGPDEKTRVRALAVASEPRIFWKGDEAEAEAILAEISIPSALGRLIPAQPTYNGPSGRALDKKILAPLNLSREDVWLCDMVPHSCLNSKQLKAIQRAYEPFVADFRLPKVTVPMVSNRYTDESRRAEILAELNASQAKTLILLGDKPIQWFLKYFDQRWKRLADFLEAGPYGTSHEAQVGEKHMKVLPLAHPRQIDQLGRSSRRWYKQHQDWINDPARRARALG